jgi:hypothetical protein
MSVRLADTIKFYLREDIQKAIILNARGRELAVKYGDKGFGKRPDLVSYPTEIANFTKQGVTSFHVSEERWSDPLLLKPGMDKKKLNELRSGWDLVIDIDSLDWEISKISTHVIVKALQELGFKSVSTKFSGNKGFHIGVPYEAFPQKIENYETKNLFPEFPKKIALYLVDYIREKYITVENNKIEFFNGFKLDYNELLKTKPKEELTFTRCRECKKEVKLEEQKTEVIFVCPFCEFRKVFEKEQDFLICEKCNKMMQKFVDKARNSFVCSCGSTEYETKFNPLSIIEIDTLLISSRHMYRCSYSFNEKSGLVGIPIKNDEILNFDKESAKPKNVKVSEVVFLDSKNANAQEGYDLFLKILDYKKKETGKNKFQREKKYEDYEDIKNAIPIDLFPPCIVNILNGLEDGKKRAMFALHNFLISVGWNPEQIKELFMEWNAKNTEPLKDNFILSHLRYHKNRRIMPPNCDNLNYYKGLQVCKPDGVCKNIKNPVNYSKKKVFLQGQNEGINQKEKKKRKSIGEKFMISKVLGILDNPFGENNWVYKNKLFQKIYSGLNSKYK